MIPSNSLFQKPVFSKRLVYKKTLNNIYVKTTSLPKFSKQNNSHKKLKRLEHYVCVKFTSMAASSMARQYKNQGIDRTQLHILNENCFVFLKYANIKADGFLQAKYNVTFRIILQSKSIDKIFVSLSLTLKCEEWPG